MRTLSGAVRSWIGNQEGVDWNDFKSNFNNPLRVIIGSSEEGDLGQLSFQGVWLLKGDKRLYPVPIHLLKKEYENVLYPLQLSEQGIYCDLGNSIRLAELSSDEAQGAKPMEDTWVDAQTLGVILQGEIPTYDEQHFVTLNQLVKQESRVGIARNNKKRAVETGLLYQTQQIRPKADVSVEIDIQGLPESCQQSDNILLRLGGEGRTATVTHSQPTQLPAPKVNTKDVRGVVLYLLSPLQLKDHRQMLPGFELIDTQQPNHWQGEIHGIALILNGAITGKSIRDGGWNLAEGKPRISMSLIPAGSLFFCQVKEGDIQKAVNALHGKQIGEKQNYGYGHLAVGLWQ
ncbi:CRISPR-associated RAMP Cmr3 [hydrothermal vent metagenome]|uniref:CRISPR-associated RAMP Cmr3 n=1 Tax=hydrothermal vent metagenome TaxID=652676 RepID=A0A1W1E4K7_9ZZZZ